MARFSSAGETSRRARGVGEGSTRVLLPAEGVWVLMQEAGSRPVGGMRLCEVVGLVISQGGGRVVWGVRGAGHVEDRME